ncbi:hypothetical protein WK32_17790 [Burkholderia vietnamiensis]|nr:hypothetical protein WK32_17790 [Burkholderia vietnamiensis]
MLLQSFDLVVTFSEDLAVFLKEAQILLLLLRAEGVAVCIQFCEALCLGLWSGPTYLRTRGLS